MVGTVLAGYRIERIAGRGGMGVVYEATDLALDRSVALKVITPDLADDARFRRRFIAESKRAAAIEHPNVIPVYAAGEERGVLFQTMRFVAGEDLRTLTAREGCLRPARVLPLAAQIGSALDAAHAEGVVHRDVKPANVLLTGQEHVYLTDFGLSKRIIGNDGSTATRGVVGSFNYIAPEQIRGGSVDARTDVYSFGCLLFQALTGSVPFDIDPDEAKLWAHVSTTPPSLTELQPDLPGAAADVVARALRKVPDERYRSAGELARELGRAFGESMELYPGQGGDPQRPAQPAADSTSQLPTSAGQSRIQRLTRVGRQRERPRLVPEIARRLATAEDATRAIDAAARREALPLAELSEGLASVVASFRQATTGAQLDYAELHEPPPVEIRKRLSDELSRGSQASRELVSTYKRKLAAQGRAASSLERFHAEVERVTGELDPLVRLIECGAAPGPELAAQVARRLGELRGELDELSRDCVDARSSSPGEQSSIRQRIAEDG